MVTQAWRNDIRHIQNGQPVDASNAGRPDRDLEGNTRYLRDRLDAIEQGAQLVAPNVTVEASAAVGMAVYIDPTDERFERAIARVAVDAHGVWVPAASCAVVGIVAYKHNDTLADVLLAGRAEIDLSAAVQGAPAAGTYYLSSALPGYLTQQEPPASVAVLTYDGTHVYVQPQRRNFVEDHVHFRFALACRPAGTHADPGSGVHTITAPNVNLPGWLPAGHASFGGRAPTGAAFGYNLAAHPALNAVFPPQPLASAQITWDKGIDRIGATLAPMGTNGVVVVDEFGIWWMSNAPGDVPWPKTYNSSSPPAPVPPNGGTPENPRLEEMRVTLHFAEMGYKTASATVTRLTAAAGSPIMITDCYDQDADTGDLKIDLDLNLLVDPALDAAGGQVLKNLVGSLFQRGWVTEGLVVDAASPNLEIASTHQRILNEGEPDEQVVHQGIITLTLDNDPAARILQPEIVALQDVVEQDFQDIRFLGFPPGRQTSVRLLFLVPSVGVPAGSKLKLRTLLLGRTTGTLPNMAFTYRRLARPAGGGQVPLALKVDEVVGTFTTGQAVTTNNYVEAESAPFDVVAGDMVFCTLLRSAADGYVGEVGLLDVSAVVSIT